MQIVVVVESRMVRSAVASRVSVSSHIRSYGSRALARRAAPPNLKWNPTSSAIPTSGPRVSLKVPIIRSAWRRPEEGASPTPLGTPVPSGSSSKGIRFVLIAVKPRSSTSLANSSKSATVRTGCNPNFCVHGPARAEPQ